MSYLDTVTEVMTTVKKSHLCFHKCINWCSLKTNEDLFTVCDCSIIYVEQKGIINNLGTDAARAKLCVFIIRLTKYQFTHKLTLHNRMCSHSLVGVMLKFIVQCHKMGQLQSSTQYLLSTLLCIRYFPVIFVLLESLV